MKHLLGQTKKCKFLEAWEDKYKQGLMETKKNIKNNILWVFLGTTKYQNDNSDQ